MIVTMQKCQESLIEALGETKGNEVFASLTPQSLLGKPVFHSKDIEAVIEKNLSASKKTEIREAAQEKAEELEEFKKGVLSVSTVLTNNTEKK